MSRAEIVLSSLSRTVAQSLSCAIQYVQRNSMYHLHLPGKSKENKADVSSGDVFEGIL